MSFRGPPVLWLALAYAAGLATLAASLQPPLALLAPLLVTAPILSCLRPTVGRASVTALLAGVVAVAGAERRGARACRSTLGPGPTTLRGAFVSGPAPGRRAAWFAIDVGPGGCSGRARVVLPSGIPVEVGIPSAVTGRWVPPDDGRYADGLLVASRLVGLDTDIGISHRVDRFRQRVEARLTELFPRRHALVHALVLARKDGLDPEVREGFALTGLAHLLAISGFHVGVVAAMLVGLGRGVVGLGSRSAAVAAAAGVWVYVLSIGAPDAAVRAAALLTLGAVARLRARPLHSMGALAAAFLIMAVADPTAPGRVGLQLSFAGAAGLVLLCGPLARQLERPPLNRLPAGVRQAMAAGASATLFTLPLVAWHFERVSLVGIPATLLAGPLVAAAIPGIFAALVLSLVASPAARFLAGGVEWILDAVVGVVNLMARVPFASLPVARGAVVVAALGFVMTPRLMRSRHRISRAARRGVGLGGAAAAVLAWPALVSLVGTGTLEAVFLDVGQGDAIALKSPRGRWVLVDTGPRTEGNDAGARVVAPFFRSRGVRRLAALVLTHPDLDHIGGAPAVLDAVDVETVFDPGSAVGKPAYLDVLRGAEAEGAPWLPLARGRVLELDGVELRALHPPPPGTDGSGLDPNNRSVVLLVRYGSFSLLLTGDVEREGEALLVTSGELRPVNVLKVAHHGSSTSSTPAFLDATLPEVAVVQVGARNRYGHPDADVISRLEAGGATVYRTDRGGRVTVVAHRDGGYRVRSARRAAPSPLH